MLKASHSLLHLLEKVLAIVDVAPPLKTKGSETLEVMRWAIPICYVGLGLEGLVFIGVRTEEELEVLLEVIMAGVKETPGPLFNNIWVWISFQSDDETAVHSLLGCPSVSVVWRNSKLPFVEWLDFALAHWSFNQFELFAMSWLNIGVL
ncbi:uncharacterized protein G2W53_000142 [Senna tora]|uniref:Uncharacterized protein n=1 Tax=Senna tora TaxID=362788 RepID=A0A834XDW3_9FABA|nr:uncharacterized protein G2W53_000142 [Senna tora]